MSDTETDIENDDQTPNKDSVYYDYTPFGHVVIKANVINEIIKKSTSQQANLLQIGKLDFTFKETDKPVFTLQEEYKSKLQGVLDPKKPVLSIENKENILGKMVRNVANKKGNQSKFEDRGNSAKDNNQNNHVPKD